MWTMLIMAVMIAFAGHYAVLSETTVRSAMRQKDSALAASMGTYRAGVIRYMSNNKSFSGDSVSSTLLETTLPGWYTIPHSDSSMPAPLWQNYIAPDRTIYIYASTSLPLSVVNEIVELSQKSVLAGMARADMTLYAPADHTGKPPIPLPPVAGISPGSPVWIGFEN